MAPRTGTDILQLKEGDKDRRTRKPLRWDYFNTQLQIDPSKERTAGAFRAFVVADLQRTTPIITLTEWTDLVHGQKRARHSKNYPNYAAISHVWDPSNETLGTAKHARRPLKVRIKDKPYTQVISWHGLVEAADAASQLGCTYLWLDFLCIDQIPRDEENREKQLQIYNMGNIYKNARNVICMLGGVSAVQSLTSRTGWMDRAWTLQEATLNWRRTYAYVKWPYLTRFTINTPGSSKGLDINFMPVTRQPDNKHMLIKLRNLLEMSLLTLDATSTPPSLSLPIGFKVLCLDGGSDEKFNTARASRAAKNAMLSVFSALSRELRLAGVWRAMLLRISTKPVDIVYSVMGLFDVEVDPYREDRKVQYLFNDLARKAAAIGKNAGMGWLVIGGVLGSVGKLNRDRKSFLIPRVPDYTRKEKRPTYTFNGRQVLSAKVVDDSKTSIKKYDIQFHTNSRPHIMCARILKVANITNKTSGPLFNTASFTIDGKRSQCRYNGTIRDGIRAMVVGTVGTWGDIGGRYDNQHYVMFMEWTTRNGWVLKGDGIVTNISDTWLKLKPRWDFTVGKGGQRVRRMWPCNSIDWDKPVMRTKRLSMSYGVLPLKNYVFNASDVVPKRRIHWFGLKGDRPSSKKWHTFEFWNESYSRLPTKVLERNYPLKLVACSSANPPDYIDVQSTSRLYEFVYLPMELTDVSMGLAGPDTWSKIAGTGNIENLNALSYRVSVWFTKYVIYLKSVPKGPKRSKPEFTNTAVAPYSRKKKRVRVLNSDYVITRVRVTIFLMVNSFGSNNTFRT
ncbi:hypothetical protein JOM56_009703 [Amanita muscaria]